MTRYLLEVVGAVQLERPRMHLGRPRVEIGSRRRFELEMAVTVDAPNQVGGMVLRAGVAHRGRNVADADADAPVTRAILPVREKGEGGMGKKTVFSVQYSVFSNGCDGESRSSKLQRNPKPQVPNPKKIPNSKSLIRFSGLEVHLKP